MPSLMLGRKWADRPDVSKLAVIPGFRSCGPKPNPSGNHKKQSRSSGHRPHQRTKKLFHPTTEPNRDRRLVPDSNAPPDISLERFWKRDVHLGGPQEVIKRRIISFLGTIGWFLVHIFRNFFALPQNVAALLRLHIQGIILVSNTSNTGIPSNPCVLDKTLRESSPQAPDLFSDL